MKKAITGIILVIMIVAAFAGCSPSIEGLYKTKSIDGKTPVEFMEAQAQESGIDLDTFLGIFALTGETVTRDDLNEYLTVDLQKDGKAKVFVLFDNESTEGTWEKKDNIISVTVNGDTLDFTLEGGNLTVDMEGSKLVLSK